MSFKVSTEIVSRRIYQDLRIQCGLSPKTDEAAEKGLKNSICCVSLEVEGRVVGMGRIVGDGGCFCQWSTFVLPEFQGRGLGKIIVKNLIDFVKEELPESCYISLIADGEARNLYEQYGFRDTLPESTGMFFNLRLCYNDRNCTY